MIQPVQLQDTIIFLAVGLVVMFIVKKFRTMAKILNYPYFDELFGCGLCLGVWTYFFLAFVFDFTLIDLPIIGQFLTGCICSFIVWVFVAGWNSLFRDYIITSE